MPLQSFAAWFGVFLISLSLTACDAVRGIGADHPLPVKTEQVSDEAGGRSGTFYDLLAGSQRPKAARNWLSASDWQALPMVEKIEAIESERRRGNVILIDGANAYLLPELNLTKPEKTEPVFKQPSR